MAQELVNHSSSRYVRVQSYGDSLGIIITKQFCENLGLKRHDTLRVTQNNDVLLVRKALEEVDE